LGQNYAAAQQGAGALERIFGLFDAKNSVVDAVDAVDAGDLSGDIRFANVGFAYADGSAALVGTEFSVKPGSRVAFVGRSGAGKSTLFKLLTRLYDVSSGAVMLDGRDIRGLRIASVRRQIALVSQDSVLLEGTIAENIGFGRAGASRAEIEAAAVAAHADGFIKALPMGYDTPVSAGEFSGGERQRLSIARAILRDAPILLLDEPTSALDAQSEHAVQAALRALESGRTTLIIAHRLATILDADQIVVMDGGRVVGQGTHTELLAQGGLYADLYRLQFAGA
jgi:ATP-binding cassette, subfamily B, bacterial MsbA